MSRQPFTCQDDFALATEKPVLSQGAEHRCECEVDPSLDPMQGSIAVGREHFAPPEGDEAAESDEVD